MVNNEQGYRDEVSSDAQADSRTQWDMLRRMTSARKKIALPVTGVWVCPEHFQPREVSFITPAQSTHATLMVQLYKDQGYDLVDLLGGIKHTMEPLMIDIDAGSATGIIVWA